MLSDHALHLAAELDAMQALGRALHPGEPLPECRCQECTLTAPAPLHEPDLSGIICPRCDNYRDLVRDTDSVWYQCRSCRTVSASAWPLSAVGTMAESIPRGTRQRRHPIHAQQCPLDVDAARAVPVVTVATLLGLEVNRYGWARCPFHDDTSPSLHLNARKGAAFCNVCGRQWDGIALVMELRSLSFADAVRTLTEWKAAA